MPEIIHIDVDAAEINKNMPADDFLVSDAKTFLSGILPYIQETKHDAWRAQIEEWRVKLDYKPKDAEDCLHPHQIVQICTELVERTLFSRLMLVSIKCGRHNIVPAVTQDSS